MLCPHILVTTLLLLPHAGDAMAQTSFEESFNSYPLSTQSWNSCQAAHRLNAPRVVDGTSGNFAYGFGIDDEIGVLPCPCQIREQCTPGASVPEVEPLLYQAPVLPIVLPRGDPCSGYDRSRIPAVRKLQKNELRLWREDWPTASSGTWLSLRFRIEGAIDRCGSMRWVGGQIKAHGKDESPFVAQRFDNGVFHITIEGPHRLARRIERVIVARAAGDPDRGSGLAPWGGGETVTCDMSSGAPRPDGCGIAGRVVPLGGTLPSINGGRWIQMDYYVRMRGKCDLARPQNCDRILEIWADGLPVVRTVGSFGVVDAEEALLNVKLGVYRDLQAGNARMTVDEFSMRYDPEKEWSPAQRLSSVNP